MSYGDSLIATDQQTGSATWNSNYKAVYHLNSTSSASDSTSNANHGTVVGTIQSTVVNRPGIAGGELV
jgi:hypothetical protein